MDIIYNTLPGEEVYCTGMDEGTQPHIDFIGIGMSRCGSTWVWACLTSHPDICCAKRKEVHFYDKQFSNGWTWYAAQYDHCTPGVVRGEFTPLYATDPTARDVIPQVYPQARLILAVRDPLERLHSAWRFQFGRGVHEYTSFQDYLTNCGEEQWDRGRYGAHLSWWLTHYHKEQIHLVFYDDITSDPARVARELFAFVGVDTNHIPTKLTERINAPKQRRARVSGINPLIHRVDRLLTELPVPSVLRSVVQRLGLASRVRKVLRRLRRWNTVSADRHVFDPTLSEEVWQRVVAYYEEDIARLEKLSGRSLEGVWLTRPSYVTSRGAGEY